MKKWFFCLALLFSVSAIAQVAPPADSVLFSMVEIEPKYKGGLKAWSAFIQRNLKSEVPVKNGAPAGNYNVIVEFVVEVDGSLTEIRALTNHGYGMESEVIRVIKLSPNWSAGIMNGKPIRVRKRQPITFVVIDDSKKGRRSGGGVEWLGVVKRSMGLFRATGN